jgi:hypothetical protein
MTSTGTEQILIVESNNLSFNDNKLNKFRTRLQREIVLNGPHEIALLDVTIPQQIYNVEESNYFTISRYGTKKRNMKKQDYVTHNLDGFSGYLEYTVRCKIPAGYYDKVDDLIRTVTENMYNVINYENLQITKSTVQKLLTSENQPDVASKNYWYSRDSENIDDKITSIKSLNRIKFHKESQRVVIISDTASNSEQWRTQISVSTDIAHILGYDHNIILFPHIPGTISYAPFISKISPEDTIYIYSSVINNIRVSNHEVKLLRAIPFSYNSPEFGSNYFIEFNNAHFVELNTSRLLYLDFELRGVLGNLIQFEHGTKPVRLSLKIRPCKRNI